MPSRALPRGAVLVTAAPFDATLLLFGTTEVIGHLPVHGVVLTLLAHGSQRATAAEAAWLPTARQTLAGVRRVVTYGRSTAPAAGRARGPAPVGPRPGGSPALA